MNKSGMGWLIPMPPGIRIDKRHKDGLLNRSVAVTPVSLFIQATRVCGKLNSPNQLMSYLFQTLINGMLRIAQLKERIYRHSPFLINGCTWMYGCT